MRQRRSSKESRTREGVAFFFPRFTGCPSFYGSSCAFSSQFPVLKRRIIHGAMDANENALFQILLAHLDVTQRLLDDHLRLCQSLNSLPNQELLELSQPSGPLIFACEARRAESRLPADKTTPNQSSVGVELDGCDESNRAKPGPTSSVKNRSDACTSSRFFPPFCWPPQI
jgi:hypothetical protein